ncbi:MAG TPA: potassium-transporting ATPase subunit C [Anaeromyxobacteraceae bacterium]|nr:potassium-transporting ATPase subunit C [Anaeromyxobacteraceae bacterium]
MLRHISKSLLLLGISVALLCGLYPAILWAIGHTFFPFQANGSIVNGPDGKPVGSLHVAQPFTKDEYFQPRPSAASYDASASASSSLAPSNYALRDRVAKALGPIVRYAGGPKKGQLVGLDVESWFQADQYQGNPHIVAQWAEAHNSIAQSWVTGDATHGQYVDTWTKQHPDVVAQWVKDNPATPQPKASDLAVVFFEHFSKENPGRFPSAVTHQSPGGKTTTSLEPVKEGTDIQSTFFEMWRQEHAEVSLENVPADMVTASGSGLDPDITLVNARFQLDRVAAKWAKDMQRDEALVRKDIERILVEKSWAPMGGLFGEKLVNVLQVNLELQNRFGSPAS